MSNRVAKMAKKQTPSYDFTKGGKAYGRVVLPQAEIEKIKTECTNETAKVMLRVFMSMALEVLEQDFGFGAYMRQQFANGITNIYDMMEKGEISADHYFHDGQEREETQGLFKKGERA